MNIVSFVSEKQNKVLNTVCKFTLTSGSVKTLYTNLRASLSLQQNAKWCHHYYFHCFHGYENTHARTLTHTLDFIYCE